MYFVHVKRNAQFIAEPDYWQWRRAPTSIRQSFALLRGSDLVSNDFPLAIKILKIRKNRKIK
jgi:hypothetical protein